MFVDKSYSANELTAAVLPVTIGSTSTDDKAPELLVVNGAAPIKFYDSKSVGDDTYGDALITVDLFDASGLKSSTILDKNSYTLNNAGLPSTSYVTIKTLNEKGEEVSSATNPTRARAYVYIPSSSITETKDYVFAVNGVTDTAGNVIDGTVAQQKGKLTSRISPAFDSAVVSSGGSTELILGFSKDLNEATTEADLKANLEFYINTDVNSSNKISSDNILSITPIKYGSDKGKWSVKFSKKIIDSAAGAKEELDLNANGVNRIIVKVKKDAAIFDADGNKIKGETEISAK